MAGISSNFWVVLNPNLEKTLNAAKAAKMVELAQECSAAAKKWRPQRIDTGNNNRSIDWACPPAKQAPAGVSVSDGDVAIFTQSGYGGYLEVGTAKIGPVPYIVPAAEHTVRTKGQSILGGMF